MKQGDKSRVFEVTEKQRYKYGSSLIGKQFVEQKNDFIGYDPVIVSPIEIFDVKHLYFTIKDLKPIGQLIIKKVK